MRRRINISVSPELYNELDRIRKEYGFRNLCEVTVAQLNLLVQMIHHNEYKVDDAAIAEEADDERDIEEMFQSFGSWQRTPDGTVPVRHPRQGID